MKRWKMRAAAVMVIAAMLLTQLPVLAKSTGSAEMYRLYNPNSGEHFYTANASEKNALRDQGWRYEGIGWIAPEHSDTPVYRLYNPNAGDHHYTMSAAERDMLKTIGWKYEGVGWYSDDAKSVPLYRQYNPNAKTGTHNYTTSKAENDGLVRLGWRGEGVGWYAIGGGNLFEAVKVKIVFNTDRNDHDTDITTFSKYQTVWIHCTITGGDTEGEYHYVASLTFPDGETKSLKTEKKVPTNYVLSYQATCGSVSGTATARLSDEFGHVYASRSFNWV